MEDRLVKGAVDALVPEEVVDFVFGATLALEGLEAKVLGMEALDARAAIVESVFSLALALPRGGRVDPIASACCTVLQSVVPVLGQHATHALEAVELGSVGWAGHASLGCHVVDVVGRAARAFLLSIVPVLRDIALDAIIAVPE